MPCLTPVATHTGKLKRLCLHKYRATVDSRVRVAAGVVIDTTVGLVMVKAVVDTDG